MDWSHSNGGNAHAEGEDLRCAGCSGRVKIDAPCTIFLADEMCKPYSPSSACEPSIFLKCSH